MFNIILNLQEAPKMRSGFRKMDFNKTRNKYISIYLSIN